MVGMAEVEVDTETGEVDVLDYVAVVDCGTPINPNLARVQTEGGIVQGMGMTLYEDVQYTEAGKTPVSWNFTTMPSENWKNNLGGALLNYAQGTGTWDSVQTAFVDGWAEEYAAANE